MDIDYSKMISFRRLGETLDEKQMKVKELADMMKVAPTSISAIISGVRAPLSGLVAEIAGLLRVRVSDICVFKGYEIKDCFKGEPLYRPASDAGAELTYRPLRRFLERYLDEHPGKTADDLYDRIETVRITRKNIDAEQMAKMLRGRGLDPGMEPKTKRNRKDYTHGMSYAMRTKLRQDRPLNIRVIYDICRYLGCGIDWVMSYK